MLLQKYKNFYNNILFYTWKEGASQTYDTPSGEKLRFNLLQPLLNTKARTLLRSSSIVTFCAKVRVSAGMRATADSPSVASPTVLIDNAKVRNKKSPMSFNVTIKLIFFSKLRFSEVFLFIQRFNRRSSETSHFRPTNKLFPIYKQVISNS